MRDRRVTLVEGLVEGAHADGGWCKSGATRSLTVSSEVIIALCDYYAQAPSAPSQAEVELLRKIDQKLNQALPFLLATVKKRDAAGAELDPPNCALALAAYLSLRSHGREIGRDPESLDAEFVGICLRRAAEKAAWLEDKPGAIWACAKALEIIAKDLIDAQGEDTRAALNANGIETFSARLQAHMVRLFKSEFVEERQLYGASVCLDLSFSARKWADDLSQSDVDAARAKSAESILSTFPTVDDALRLSLSNFYQGSGEDKNYQVVAPAAFVSGVDRLLAEQPLNGVTNDTWMALFYTVADEMGKQDPRSAAVYVTAHHLRALTASQLAAREVEIIRSMMRERGRLHQAAEYRQNQAELDDLLVRYGNPGDTGFFASSTKLFVVFTTLLYALALTSLLASPAGSVASIAAALCVAVVLTPLSLVIWARKEKLHEKPPAERSLSIVQFFLAGGWIAIPIFVAYISSWFKNIATATFGH